MTGQERGAGRRETFLDGAVDHVLEHGVTGLSLRPLAADLGTSDRMLLYYFGTREELLRSVLETVAGRLRTLIVGILPPGQQSPANVLAAALSVADDPEAHRLLTVWIEVVALAARGDATCGATAEAVVGDWIGWLAGRLDVPSAQSRAAAAGLMAVVDGLVLLDAAGAAGDATAGAGWLVQALGRPAGPPAPA